MKLHSVASFIDIRIGFLCGGHVAELFFKYFFGRWRGGESQLIIGDWGVDSMYLYVFLVSAHDRS